MPILASGKRAAERVECSVVALVIAYLLRARWFSLACAAVVALSVALPPQGLGLPACQFKELTQLPCFGCGLTRSFVGMAHLDLVRAVVFHPLGVPLFALTCLFGGLLPAPRRVRERCAAWALRRPRLVNGLSIALAVGFAVYGLARLVYGMQVLNHGGTLPW
jgi:hypothetical protein